MYINPILTSERVEAVFIDCLFEDDEDTSKRVIAEGITLTVGFHPERLEGHKAEITAMLDELPNEFKKTGDGGGGMSFLAACNDKHGNQWTGFHLRMEQLFLLGMAINKVECLLTKQYWSVMPGGMPYYSIA